MIEQIVIDECAQYHKIENSETLRIQIANIFFQLRQNPSLSKLKI